MQRFKRWLAMTMLMGPTLFGMQCGTDFKDAVTIGAIDYVSGTTQSLLAELLYPGRIQLPQAAAPEE